MNRRPSASVPAVLAGAIALFLAASVSPAAHASVTSGGEEPMLDAQFDRDLLHRMKRKLEITRPDREVAHTNQPPAPPLLAPMPRGGIDLVPEVGSLVPTIRPGDAAQPLPPLDPGGPFTVDPPLPGLLGPALVVLGSDADPAMWFDPQPDTGDGRRGAFRVAPAVIPAPGAAALMLAAAMAGVGRRRRG